MRILGIDPGTSLIGYGIIDADNGTYHVVDFGIITTPPKIPNRDRVTTVYDAVDKLITTHKPDILAIEQLFFFKNAKTIMAVSEMRGVLLLAGAKNGLLIKEFTPLQVKQAVSAYGRSSKAAIKETVSQLLDLDDLLGPDDIADALALAICSGNTKLD